MSPRELLASALPAVVVAFGALLPFLGKAFTIDDVTFLLQAKHLLADPLHPSAFDMVADGVSVRLSDAIVSGPVMAYLLVPSVLAGGAEWVAHVVQVIVLAAGAVATAALALRLGLGRFRAGLAALLVVTSPAVLGMAATAMPDVEAMTFGVAGIERVLAWRDTRRASSAVCAGLLLALAVLSRPHALLLLACAAILVIADDSWAAGPRRWVRDVAGPASLPLLIAGVTLVAVEIVTRDPLSGAGIAKATTHRFHTDVFWRNLANVPVQWTLAFPLALIWPLLDLARFVRSRAVLAGAVAGAVLGATAHSGAWSPSASIHAAIAGLGAAVLVDIVVDAWRRRDRVQMALAAWLWIPVAAAPYVHLPAKCLVVSAPAMAVLIVRAGRFPGPGRAHSALAAVAVTAGAVLGVLIIRADAAMAEVGRAGGEIVAGEVRRGARVWTDGTWGFQWYSMQAGARPMAENLEPPVPGDVVVTGPNARLLDHACPRRTLMSRRVFADAGGRVMSRGARAGFFSNGYGPLPWAWADDEIGRIEVWRIDE